MFIFSFKGLAKRVHARLLLASTSEVYGGKKSVISPLMRNLNGRILCFYFNLSLILVSKKTYLDRWNRYNDGSVLLTISLLVH